MFQRREVESELMQTDQLKHRMKLQTAEGMIYIYTNTAHR